MTIKQNCPNPFNPSTTIRYSVAKANPVTLIVYDLLGRAVAHLAEGNRQAGEYSVTWHAENVPSGVYLCRFTAGSYSEARKLIMMR